MDDRMQRPHDADCARSRIEAAVREVQIICDEFGFDPYEWLNDETAQGERPPFYHCNICDGMVNFPKGAKPTTRIGVEDSNWLTDPAHWDLCDEHETTFPMGDHCPKCGPPQGPDTK